jgi:hypothetical protein
VVGGLVKEWQQYQTTHRKYLHQGQPPQATRQGYSQKRSLLATTGHPHPQATHPPTGHPPADRPPTRRQATRQGWPYYTRRAVVRPVVMTSIVGPPLAGGLGRVACVALAPASGNASEGHALPVAWQG